MIAVNTDVEEKRKNQETNVLHKRWNVNGCIYVIGTCLREKLSSGSFILVVGHRLRSI